MLELINKQIRHHSLTGRITPALMLKAFRAVKRNRGAAGIYKQSIQMFGTSPLENFDTSMAELKTGGYELMPLR